jgi:hypothetical protein
MRWTGHVLRIGEKRNAYKILVGRHEWRKPFEKPRRRWQINIRTDLRKTGWKDVDWMHLDQDRDQWQDLV